MDFAHIIQQGSPRSFLLAFLLAFGGGVLASFTPCVYPMIPITISFIGGRAQSRLHAAKLSGIYVLGMSIMYTFLGLFAALTGKVFGTFTMTPIFYILVGLVILFFGALQLGWIKLKIPQWSISTGQEGYGGAFLMGLTSGLIAAPCTVPILGIILTFIATTQSFLYGALLMFSFSLGLGLLLLVLGVFAGLLTTLPKSGHWLLTLKKVAGYCFLTIGAYFLIRAIY